MSVCMKYLTNQMHKNHESNEWTKAVRTSTECASIEEQFSMVTSQHHYITTSD